MRFGLPKHIYKAAIADAYTLWKAKLVSLLFLVNFFSTTREA